MHPNPRRIIPVFLVLVIMAVVAGYYFLRVQSPETPGSLSASGTIEATLVSLSSELGGKVLEVLADNGQEVRTGQVLIRLDDTLYQAQLAQAKSQLALAEANYELVLAGTPVEQRNLALENARLEILSSQQALANLNETGELSAAVVQLEIAQAEKALDQAGKRLDTLHSNSDPADIDAARAAVVIAKDQLDKAQEDFQPYEKKPEDNLVRASLQTRLAEAQKRYDLTVTKLNNLLGEASKTDLNVAEANQALIEAQIADAQRRYKDLQNGPDPDALALAEARLSAARARLQAAQADPTEEQLNLARAQIEVAKTTVEVIRAQIAKLILTAPLEGRVISRSIEPGEVALPAAPLLVLADLNHLRITIYLPEDRYGQVNIEDEAIVTVDSFPGEEFFGRIVRIAEEAEFTPRNVQTAEGRRTTVFAIELEIENPEGKLKPGMPADVEFR
jgi:multidrug resistance efflux pump